MGTAARSIQTYLQEGTKQSLHNAGVIDTALMYEELRRSYIKSNQFVEVDFRGLIDWLRLGDQLTHQIHPYPAKLLPHIAHFFIRASSLHHREQIVLDPFCGSGTVALEASIAGCTPYVADANPFALLLTKVKTFPYDTERLELTANTLFKRIARFKTAPEVSIVNSHLWYKPEHKKSLEIILRAVEDLEDMHERDFFKICFSVTARRMSQADPAVNVPVRLKTKPSRSATENQKIQERLDWITGANAQIEFQRVVEGNIRRVNEANSENNKRIQAIRVGVDARKLVQPNCIVKPLAANTIPLIVTSPPYGSAQKYVRASSLALNWLGLASPDELARLEGKSIGREHLPKHQLSVEELAPLPKPYSQLIRSISQTNELRAKITQRYLYEMKSAVDEASRVICPGGHIVFVIGNNQVCGESLRNDDYLVHCFRENGLELELGLIDHIKSRGLMTKRNRTASVISRESVLVFKKQG